MTKEELLSLVGAEISSAMGSELGINSSELSSQRAEAMDYYLAEPFGNEVDGRSKVISTDVQDTIEWIMPSIMRVFASNNKAVEFDPNGPEDEAAAKQETAIVNHTFYKENDGFLVLYSFFKDALLQKNGIVKSWWDNTETTVKESYTGLDDNELTIILSDPDVEPLEHSEEMTENGALHDLTVNRITSRGQVRIEPVPPEEFSISNDAVSVNPKNARFTCHSTLKTRSELIEMGFSKRIVNDLPTHASLDNEESDARNHIEDDFQSESNHAPTQRVRVDECYMRVDFDGDGIAELRQVTRAGNKILVNEEVDCIPFHAITPIILTHKFFGLSVADLVMDLQLIKSTLLRGILDNVYHANNSRTAAQEGMVNLDDLLTSRPGGIVRTQGPPGAVIQPLPASPLPPEAFQAYQLLEKTRQDRTGVGQETMGLESNVLAQGKTGVVNQSFDVARMRIELIARVFAETGVKSLFLDIHRLLQQNQDKRKWFKLNGQWAQIQPTEWRERSRMTINVGLGTGNKDRITSNLTALLQVQERLIGIVPPHVMYQHAYRTMEKFVEASDLGEVSEYFPDPQAVMQAAQQAAQQPPPPDPQMEAIKIQQQIEGEKLKLDATKARWEHERKNREMELKDLRDRTDMELKYSQNVPGALV